MREIAKLSDEELEGDDAPAEPRRESHVDVEDAEPALERTADRAKKPKSSKEPKPAATPATPPAPRLSPELAAIQRDEDKSLADIMSLLGNEGTYKISVRRVKPLKVRVNGKDYDTAGFIDSYDHPIDEVFLQENHGGGTYEIRVKKRDERGSFAYARGLHRTITIAGEPKLDQLPGASQMPTPTAPASGGESMKIMQLAVDVLKDQADRKPEGPRGIDPAIQLLISQMQESQRSLEAQLTQLRSENSTLRNTEPAVDPIKDKLLSTLLDGQSGHVEALRIRQESELRQVKDSAYEDTKRLHERHDREMAAQRQSFEREITAIRQSHEIAVASAKQSYDLQIVVLRGDITRLERDNADLRDEVKELRAKKDKSIVEQAKDLQAVRDALGGGEGEEKSNFDKVMELAASPAALEAVQRVFAKGSAAAPAPAMHTQAVAARPRVVQRPDGTRFVQAADGRLIPAKRRPKVAVPAVTAPDGTEIQPAVIAPEVDPEQLKMLISYLENAYSNSVSEEIVAQNGRTAIPPDILKWIHENHTEQVSGVDLFMTKVAKLPGTSPLATLSGKNWLRKVGKALLGG